MALLNAAAIAAATDNPDTDDYDDISDIKPAYGVADDVDIADISTCFIWS